MPRPVAVPREENGGRQSKWNQGKNTKRTQERRREENALESKQTLRASAIREMIYFNKNDQNKETRRGNEHRSERRREHEEIRGNVVES